MIRRHNNLFLVLAYTAPIWLPLCIFAMIMEELKWKTPMKIVNNIFDKLENKC